MCAPGKAMYDYQGVHYQRTISNAILQLSLILCFEVKQIAKHAQSMFNHLLHYKDACTELQLTIRNVFMFYFW